MELGVLVYFLVVFGFGGALLFGLTMYFAWEVVNHRNRPAWRRRSLRAKIATAFPGFVLACLVALPLRMIWVTRVAAILGDYTSNGVWGNATLVMHTNGTFVETWRFTNEYNGAFEGEGILHGTWRNDGRDWFTRNIILTPFKGLAEYARDQRPGITEGNVMGYGGVTAIEVGAGSDIVFRK